jgi:transcriptional regulator with XRE-family HTH domain
MVRLRRSREELEEVGALVERLRDFLRLNYMTAADVARQMGVRDTTIYDWLLGKARPAKPERITAFLDSLPRENGSGVAPTGYEYREYRNWRGIPKPRRCWYEEFNFCARAFRRLNWN